MLRAQPDDRAAFEQPGVLLIEVTPALDSALGAAFIAARPVGDPEFSHSDINLARLSGDSAIRNLLGGLSGLHGLRLQPFIPTHSVAFEDIRERSNPQLFGKLETIAGVGSRAGSTDLRDAEDKISHWFVLSFSDSISDDRAAELSRKSPFIERAEPKFIQHTCYTPNDPDISQQYSLSLMHCFEAWDIVKCDSTMILADVDLGTDWSHEDLANATYLNQGEIGIDAHGLDKRSNGIDDDSNGFIDDWHGWDFAGADNNSQDNDARPGAGQGHGTRTAGIMSATGNNNIGIAGVAIGSRIIPIKVACDECGTLAYGFEGIVYAADMHAKVVNCSWGEANPYSQAEQDVINYAYAKDCAVVAACGNSYIYQNYYPGSYNHVLSVAAVDGNDRIVSFSTYNPQVDIAAPGWQVFSTVPGNGYDAGADANGTSFASPNAAGVVALVRQRFPNWTAGQAMEQVRVTGDPVTQISDAQTGAVSGIDSSGRLYFEGHGEVDAFRAVTDTNTFSARIDSVTIDDNNGTGTFAPGESGGIILNVLNYLKPLLQLKARIEIVQGDSFVTLHQTVVPFGPAGTMQSVQNDPSALQVSIANNTPPNTQVLIRVFFYDSTVGYGTLPSGMPDYDYFSFTINPNYLDLNKNNLTVTFPSMGTIGYNDPLVNNEGSGFLWRIPPPSVLSFSRSVLYQGGLMAGIDSSHVVDVIEDANANLPDMDFTPEAMVHYVTPPDHANAAQELACTYTDSLADSSIQIGLRTRCQAYAFNDGSLADNAIVVKYVFRHRDSPGVPSANDSTAAALFLDWDIGASGLINITRFDSASQTAISYRLESGYPYAGVKLLSPLPPGASLNYRAIWDDGAVGGIDPYNGLSKSDKWTMMTQFLNYAGPDDISHTFGLKNMPMRSQDSVEMTMVIALAESPELLHQTIDETAQLWSGTSSITPAPIKMAQAALEVFPNPFQHTLHVAWDASGASPSMLPARVTIYDAVGRIIDSRMVSGSEYDFTPPTVPSGFYTVDVLVGGTHLRRQVVAEE